MSKQFAGRGVSLGALALKHDQLTKNGTNELKMKVEPLRAAKQHHVPFNQQAALDFKNHKEEMKGPAITLGQKSLASEGKWRCEVCTFANANADSVCNKCKQARQLVVATKPSRTQSLVQPNMKTKPHEVRQMKEKQTTTNINSIPKKQNIVFFQDQQNALRQDPGQPKRPRLIKEPIEKQLEKIAKKTAHPEESKAERSLRSFEQMKQRQLAKDYRYPQKINAITMLKEYGGDLNLK